MSLNVQFTPANNGLNGAIYIIILLFVISSIVFLYKLSRDANGKKSEPSRYAPEPPKRTKAESPVYVLKETPPKKANHQSGRKLSFVPPNSLYVLKNFEDDK